VRAHESIDDEDERGERDGQKRDGRVLTAEESLCALLDRVGDVAHGGRAGVAVEHVFDEQHGEAERQDTDEKDQQHLCVHVKSPSSELRNADFGLRIKMPITVLQNELQPSFIVNDG
jgi:hypothetical protein